MMRPFYGRNMVHSMSKKQKPIQIHNLNETLHNFIVTGNVDNIQLSPEVILHLAKVTNNAGWLGWAISTTSRSVRSALLLELALFTIQNINLNQDESSICKTITSSKHCKKEKQIEAHIKDEAPVPMSINTQAVNKAAQENDINLTPTSKIDAERVERIKRSFGSA